MNYSQDGKERIKKIKNLVFIGENAALLYMLPWQTVTIVAGIVATEYYTKTTTAKTTTAKITTAKITTATN